MHAVGEERMMADHDEERGFAGLGELGAEPLVLGVGVLVGHEVAPRPGVEGLGAGQV